MTVKPNVSVLEVVLTESSGAERNCIGDSPVFVLCLYCPLVRHQQNDVIGNI